MNNQLARAFIGAFTSEKLEKISRKIPLKYELFGEKLSRLVQQSAPNSLCFSTPVTGSETQAATLIPSENFSFLLESSHGCSL
jgi:hypothetical protein